MINDRFEKAANLYADPHDCTQTVLDVFLKNQGPPRRELLFQAAAGLGGDLASSGFTRGVLIGGLMALNLSLVENGLPEQRWASLLKQLATEFTDRNNPQVSRDLTSIDFTEEPVSESGNRFLTWCAISNGCQAF